MNRKSFIHQFRLTIINEEEGRRLEDSLKEVVEEVESDLIFEDEVAVKVLVQVKILEVHLIKVDLLSEEVTRVVDLKPAVDRLLGVFDQLIRAGCHSIIEDTRT